ncbi:hypothetical protein [Photobacterium kasasachensis]|uniref:hypothetical protein n=1 Tax=Photobacterium kasasachensis TaxID=2910240 RepID=UPI003D131A21
MNALSPAKLLCSAVILAASGLSSAANAAANFPYNYFEVRVPLSPGGLGIAGSQEIHPNAHMIAEAESHFENDWIIGAGLGFHAAVNQFTDLNGQVKLLSFKNEENDKSMGSLASELNFGLSAWIMPQLETGGKVGVIAAEEDITIFSLYARLHTGDAFSMGAEWRIKGVNDQTLAFSVRYPF